MTPLRILVADDHEVVRQGVRALLEAESGWTVCAEACTGREAVQQALSLRPDIVVMDLAMPELNGLEATRQILAQVPDMKILALTMHDSAGVVREVLQAGVRGYVLKSDAGRSLVEAITKLSQKQPFITSTVTEVVLDGFLEPSGALHTGGRVDPLTPREREVLQLLAESKTNRQVATALGISVKTVDTHRTRIMRKLGVHSVVDLVRYAIRHHVVEP